MVEELTGWLLVTPLTKSVHTGFGLKTFMLKYSYFIVS